MSLQSAYQSLTDLGEFDTVKRNNEEIIIEVHPRTHPDLEYASNVVYEIADDHSVTVTEVKEIENKQHTGTNVRGEPTIQGQRFTLTT